MTRGQVQTGDMRIDVLGRQLYAALDAQDWSRIEQLVASDVAVQLGSAPLPISFEQWRANHQRFCGGFPDGRHVIDDELVAGNQFVTRCRFQGTHTGVFAGKSPTGAAVCVGVIHIDRFSDGRLIEHHGQLDMLGLMQQIGAAS